MVSTVAGYTIGIIPVRREVLVFQFGYMPTMTHIIVLA